VRNISTEQLIADARQLRARASAQLHAYKKARRAFTTIRDEIVVLMEQARIAVERDVGWRLDK